MKRLQFPIGTNPRARLVCFLHEDAKEPLPATIWCPGGAYVFLAPEEGEPIARAFYERGFHAFVLEYSVGFLSDWPQPVAELGMAVKLLREHATEWRLAPEEIAVGGFSAGGHLTVCGGTLWRDPEVQARAGVTGRQNRPNAMLPIYAVSDIEAVRFTNHRLETLAVDCLSRIDADTPPAFICHSWTDEVVSAEQSLRLAEAMLKAGRLCELHMFTCGAHGALGRPSAMAEDGVRIPGYEAWIDRAAEWLGDIFGREIEKRVAVRAPLEKTMPTCLIGYQYPFPLPGGVHAATQLRALVGSPAAVQLLSDAVPLLRELEWSGDVLSTELGVWLQSTGLDVGNFYAKLPPEPAAQAIFDRLAALL